MGEIGPIIGLTGGIATGKTTVSRMLVERGCRVIDADAVAREIVRPGEPALDEIRSRFGDGVIAPEGSLDRAALGDVDFSDPPARADLNAITHPRIGLRMLEHARSGADEGFAWQLYDAALIVENGLHHALAGLHAEAQPHQFMLAARLLHRVHEVHAAHVLQRAEEDVRAFVPDEGPDEAEPRHGTRAALRGWRVNEAIVGDLHPRRIHPLAGVGAGERCGRRDDVIELVEDVAGV